MAEYPSRGIKNRELASLAIRKRCILLTRDRDFANTIMYPPKQFHGIIVLNIHPPKAEKLIRRIESLLSKIKNFEGKLIIVKDGTFEITEDKS